MLGNQLFLARKYSQAADNLELALKKDPQNLDIKRKLVICFTQIGQIDKALSIFISILRKNVEFIINTDPLGDDCPCPELVQEMEKMLCENRHSLDYQLIMGMLWLYCSLEKSLQYFLRAQQILPENQEVNTILKILNNHNKKTLKA